MDKNNQLETAPIGKLVFKLAIPTVMAQLVNLLYNIVDRIYVGRIPEIGSLSLAGLGVTFPIILLVSAFAMLAGMGGASRAAVSMGEKDNDKAEKILGNCTMLLIIFSVVLAVVFMLTKNQILMKFGASEATLPYASDYISIYLVGTIFVQIALGLNLFITNQGFAKTSMMTVCIGAVLNIVLDPIFIFGLHMGVRGAALATIISQACSCIWVVSFLFGKKTFLKIQRKNMKLEARIILPSLALGLATFIMQASESIITVCFNSSLLKYGGDIAVGAMTILTSVMQFAMLPLQGLGQGAQPILSYNYGAKNVDRVRGTFRLLLKVSVGYAVILWLCVELFPQIFVSMFTSDAALLAFGKTALRVYMAAMFMFGIQIACQMGFTSLGCAPESIIVAVMRKFVLLIPLIYIVPHIWSADRTMGVYLAEPIADFFAVTFTMILFSNRFKKALKKIEK
mgnify:CR=1 FL=1